MHNKGNIVTTQAMYIIDIHMYNMVSLKNIFGSSIPTEARIFYLKKNNVPISGNKDIWY